MSVFHVQWSCTRGSFFRNKSDSIMHICYDLLVRPFSFIFSEYWDISTQGCVGSAIQYRPIHKILNNMIDDWDLQSPSKGSAWCRSQFWPHQPYINWECQIFCFIMSHLKAKWGKKGSWLKNRDRQSLAKWLMIWSAIHFSWIGHNPVSTQSSMTSAHRCTRYNLIPWLKWIIWELSTITSNLIFLLHSQVHVLASQNLTYSSFRDFLINRKKSNF